jgi:photosystem II stability/assembly factor-like uncharacterized protein
MKKLASILIILLITFNATAQWEMIYPNPYFENIVNIFFIDENNGWFPADNGRIYHTQDGGDNWVLQFSNTSLNIGHICFANLNTGWAGEGSGSLIHSIDGGATWNSVNSYPGAEVRAIHAIGNDTCWIAEGGNIYFSPDGGMTWQAQYSGNETFNSMSFVDDKHGWAVGYGGTALRTTDGGTTWDPMPNFIGDWLKDVCFTDTNTGYILKYEIMDPEVIFKTTDGGLSWDSLYSSNVIEDLSFQDADTGFYVTGLNAMVFVTFDGGTSWSGSVIPNTERYTSIFNNFGKAWVTCGTNPCYVFKSEDWGESWILSFPPSIPTIRDLNAVDFCTGIQGYTVGEQGTILCTSDGGDSWSIQESVTGQDLNDVQFVSESIGWIMGGDGTILKTENGGTTWNEQNEPVEENFFKASFVNETSGWIISDSTLIKTLNGGTDWEMVNLPFTYNTLQAVCFTSLNEGWLLVDSFPLYFLYHTSDSGITWEISLEFEWWVSVPAWITFTDPDHGYLSGTRTSFTGDNDWFIYKTEDGGSNWLNISPELGVGYGNGHMRAFAFLDDNHGFTAGSEAWGEVSIYETIDAGDTWQVSSNILNVPFNSLTPMDISFVNSSTAILVGTKGLIMKWSDPTIGVPEVDYNSSPKVTVYPNPSNGSITISSPLIREGSNVITVTNCQGKVLQQVMVDNLQNGQVNLNLSSLSPGLYFIRIQSPNRSFTEKLIIE